MRQTKLLLALTAIGFTSSAFATNGMNLEGYGPIATAMGGASMAYDNGTAATMNNPATLGLADPGSRLDVALGMLGPDVTAKAPGAPEAHSGGDSYLMPAIGYVRSSGKLNYGVALFAQGGMGTEYEGSSFMSAGSGLPTRSELGVGRLIAPLSVNVNDQLTIGGSLDFVWAMMDLQMAMTSQQFFDLAGKSVAMGGLGNGHTYGEAGGSMMAAFNGAVGVGFLNDGTHAGAGLGTGPLNWGYFDFSNSNDYTGKARTTGWAGKLGFTYKATPALTFGGTYHSKTSLGDMKGDATVKFNVNADTGMAAGGAPSGTYAAMTMPVTGKIQIVDFQWPETFGLGMAFQANDSLLVAVDYKRINWADVMKNFKMTFTADNSASNGGFAGTSLDATLYQNWKDQDVLEVGVGYKLTTALTLRGGVNYANNPIPDKYMNPLFPAIEKSHYTTGVGYAFSKASDVNFSLQYAPKVSQTNGQGVTVDHSQTSWQLMYSQRF
jgi:long-chain fatty acid transport protein